MNAHEAKHKLQVARTLLGTGMIQPTRPDRAVRSIRALRRWGPTPAAAYTGSMRCSGARTRSRGG